ncbi:ABC transporter substrate-binding protein [Haloechinothrix sp. LS1_15]|uniref:ABC transporter substrate-binding protein n=1 Tax=Haloechinothrix sp. LS1_15 TaxID=2652248 RepID=UPI0029468C3A|nr:ABC transporter substrate-binding protein [Haloechinothrix sp. LS1_15]MDV6011884.1 PhnD/SsuA/transferrin family substrate-binding protein [Haloechinothrix sp. LS1_15]
MRSHTQLMALVFAGALGTLAACGPAEEDGAAVDETEDGTQQVTVGALPIYSTGALHLGLEQGIFAEEDLEIEVESVPNPAGAMAAMQGGEVQFAYTPAMPMLMALSEGIDLKVVAAADGYAANAYEEWAEAGKPPELSPDDTAVLVAEGSDISSPADLEGKVVAVPARKAQMEITIASSIEQDGGDPEQVEWIALSFQDMNAALAEGRVDAAGNVTPFIDQAVAEGAEIIDFPAIGLFLEGAVGLWVTSGTFAEQDPEAVERFERAIHRANGFANENLDAALEHASEVSQIPVEVLAEGKPPHWPTEVTEVEIERAADVMVDLGYLDELPDLDELIIR